MAPTPGPRNDLTDVAGVLVGHHHRLGDGWGTGTTVVVPPIGTVGSVDVRGGGPATRETDALAPDTMVQAIDAVCLTGGSAYGLDAAGGVMAWCEAVPRGVPVGLTPERVVPIVATAAIFDLGVVGGFANRPDAAFGRAAAEAAAATGGRAAGLAQGSVGAGTGASAGILRGGLGSASVVLDGGVTVAALVVVNAAGSPVDPATGLLWGARHALAGELDHLGAPTAAEAAAHRDRLDAAAAARAALFNTTLAVIATDAELAKPEVARLAASGHDGMARALDPIHGYVDGDVVFGLATGAVPLGRPGDPLRPQGPRLAALGPLLAAGADVVARAIVRATLAATGTDHLPAYLDAFPSVARG